MQPSSNSVPEISSATILRAMKWFERLRSQMEQKRWSVPDLAAAMGRPDDENLKEKLYKYINGNVENPRGLMVADIAKAVGMTEAELRAGSQHETSMLKSSSAVVENPGNATLGGAITGFSRIPIRGQGMGGRDGSLVFNGDEHLGDVLAPPALMNVTSAYAVYVVGDSMLERFRAGEVVYVNPHQPVRKGDDCVVQILMANGDRHGWVKRFVSRDDKFVKVEQLNPKKIMKFDARSVVSVHKIIMAGPA